MAHKMFNVLILSEDPKYSKGGIVTVTDMIINHPVLRESVKQMILVIGGAGYIGSVCVEQLLTQREKLW